MIYRIIAVFTQAPSFTKSLFLQFWLQTYKFDFMPDGLFFTVYTHMELTNSNKYFQNTTKIAIVCYLKRFCNDIESN